MKKQQGITLIEVLVALVILSIGLLGIAGLQAQSMRMNHGAYVRTQAIIIAGDIMDRLRIDRLDALKGDYNYSGTGTLPSEVTAWGLDLSELTNGGYAISCSSSTKVCLVTVRWEDLLSGQQNYMLSAQL